MYKFISIQKRVGPSADLAKNHFLEMMSNRTAKIRAALALVRTMKKMQVRSPEPVVVTAPSKRCCLWFWSKKRSVNPLPVVSSPAPKGGHVYHEALKHLVLPRVLADQIVILRSGTQRREYFSELQVGLRVLYKKMVGSFFETDLDEDDSPERKWLISVEYDGQRYFYAANSDKSVELADGVYSFAILPDGYIRAIKGNAKSIHNFVAVFSFHVILSGVMEFKDGRLVMVSNDSGTYQPTAGDLKNVLSDFFIEGAVREERCSGSGGVFKYYFDF